MKQKYMAAFQLASLHTLPWLLALCVALAALQLGAFWWALSTYQGATFIVLLEAGLLNHLFRGGLALVCALALVGCHGKSNPGYTLRRLGLPSSHMGLAWSVNVALCFVIVWGVEIVILLGCKALFQAQTNPAFWSQQSFFIDCYRSGFLHAVLPMGDVAVWVRNVFSVVAMSLASGSAFVNTWRGAQPKLALFTTVMLYLSFETLGTAMDYFMIGLYAIVIFGALTWLFNSEEDTWKD